MYDLENEEDLEAFTSEVADAIIAKQECDYIQNSIKITGLTDPAEPVISSQKVLEKQGHAVS